MPTQNQPVTMQTLSRMLALDVRAVEGEDRVIELSFSSEVPVQRWFGAEILSHDPENIDLSRLLEVGSFLFTHGRDPQYGRMPIGRIVDAWVEKEQRKCKAKVRFDEDEKSELAYQKALNGSLRGVSNGYAVDVWEEVAAGKTSTNGRFTGPCYVAVKWSPLEISLEPTPADPAVGVGRSLEDEPEINGKGRRDSSGRSKTSLFERQLQINKNLLQEGE